MMNGILTKNNKKFLIGLIPIIFAFILISLVFIFQHWIYIALTIIYGLYLMAAYNFVFFKIGDKWAGIAFIFCGIVFFIYILDIIFKSGSTISMEIILVYFLIILGFISWGSSFLFFWYEKQYYFSRLVKKHQNKKPDEIDYIK